MMEHIFSLQPDIKSLEPWPGAALLLASRLNTSEAVDFLIAKGSDIEGKRPADRVSRNTLDRFRAGLSSSS